MRITKKKKEDKNFITISSMMRKINSEACFENVYAQTQNPSNFFVFFLLFYAPKRKKER